MGNPAFLCPEEPEAVVSGSSVAAGRGTERLTERLFSREPDTKNRLRSHCLEGCGPQANCESRGQRTQLQSRLGRLHRRFVSGFFCSWGR